GRHGPRVFVVPALHPWIAHEPERPDRVRDHAFGADRLELGALEIERAQAVAFDERGRREEAPEARAPEGARVRQEGAAHGLGDGARVDALAGLQRMRAAEPREIRAAVRVDVDVVAKWKPVEARALDAPREIERRVEEGERLGDAHGRGGDGERSRA